MSLECHYNYYTMTSFGAPLWKNMFLRHCIVASDAADANWHQRRVQRYSCVMPTRLYSSRVRIQSLSLLRAAAKIASQGT